MNLYKYWSLLQSWFQFWLINWIHCAMGTLCYSGFTEVIFNEDTFLPACNKYCFHYQFDWTLNSTWSYFEELWRQDIACYKIFTDKKTPFRYFSAFIISITLTTINLLRSIKYNRFSKLTYILILHNTYLHHQNR